MIENSRNVYEAQFSLIICADKLDFGAVTAGTGISPTKLISNGEQLSRLPNIVSHEDAWCCTIQLSNPEGSDSDLIGLLDRITVAREYMKQLLDNGCNITLRLALTTEKAFMGYRLNPDTIMAIQRTGFPIDITSVSWGGTGF